MAVLVDWGDSDEIILLLKFEERWTWYDAGCALKQSKNLVEGLEQTVILMIDLHRAMVNPTGLLNHFPEFHKHLSEEIEQVIFIDQSKMFYSPFHMLRFRNPQMMKNCVKVNSVEDAYRTVNSVASVAI